LTIGTARTRVGVSSNQSGDDESTISAGFERPLHLRTPLRAHPLADDVPIEKGGCSTRTRVRDGDERSVVGLDPDHDVRRGEVREKLTVTGESVQPLDIVVGKTALGIGEVAER